ncbi:hypothetical protein SMSK321_0253 [Streptococcus mitis SK321]|nr:hypothetical protein SMSK321_0253 [Streptococcus mitis SK321]
MTKNTVKEAIDGGRVNVYISHMSIVNHLVDNTRQLEELAIFERIQIYQRDRSCVYDSKENTTSVEDVFQELLFGEWSQVEKEMLQVGEKRLNELLEK